MVSTRQMQMATSSGSGHNGAVATSVPTEATRTSAYAPVLVRTCGVAFGAGAGPSSLAHTPNIHTRQTHLTQAVKASGSASYANQSQLMLFDLPTEILGQILGYVGYKKIGQLRMVSQKFNDVCMHILNSTFSKLITQTFNRFHAIKANMPRRESARRNHPLACECDIIETCYMRLSLLQMTFGKHIERGHCCFFPGAILDEVYTILFYIKNTPRLERPYRVTDELFDLSTMAMEYFRDRIEPTLPDIAYFNKDFFKLPTTAKRPALVVDLVDSPSNMSSPPQSNMVLRKGIRKIKQGMKMYNNQLSVLRSELRTCKRKSSEQGKQIADQQKLLAEQQKQTLEYVNRLDENDKKNEEMSRKFSTLLQELNKCKTELQYWRSKSPAIPTCTSCGQKVTPMLPPEDYQALINQGVKPEDIILNLADETEAEVEADAESDVNGVLENNRPLGGSEFVFPDETTTAKLLAVNTATKNLKRQHAATAAITTTPRLGLAMFGDNDSSKLQCENAIEMPSISGEQPREMTNNLNCIKSEGNIIRISCNALPPIVDKDLNKNAASAAINNSKKFPAEPMASGSSGYSTKLFYGTSAHKGVIVSPLMLSKVESPSPSAEGVKEQAGTPAAVGGGVPECGGLGVAVGDDVDDVASLQNIVSHETKKARRVQKATKLLNGSGKRSK